MAFVDSKTWFRLSISGLLVAALAESGRAQDEYEQAPDIHELEDEIPDAGPERLPLRIRLNSDTRFIVGSDFGASDANLYWPRGSLQIGVPLSERAGVRFRMNGGAAAYDFDGTTNLFGVGPSSGDPFDALYSAAFAGEGVYRVREAWGLFAQGFVAARWEDSARFDNAITGGGGLAVGYRIPDRLDVIVGAGLKSRLDRGGLSPYPLIDLEWMIDDRWKLRVHGTGAALEYAISDAFRLFLRGRMETRSYRLDDRLGPASRGTVRDRQIPVGLGFRWEIHRNIRIGVVAGAMLEHRLKVRDRNRDTISSISSDPSPYFEFQVALRP